MGTNGDRLYSKNIKSHLIALESASKRIINYADKIVAHDTVACIPTGDTPNFSEIAECIGVIEDVAKHYITALTAAGYVTLSPVAQYDEFDVFRFPWLTSSDEIIQL